MTCQKKWRPLPPCVRHCTRYFEGIEIFSSMAFSITLKELLIINEDPRVSLIHTSWYEKTVFLLPQSVSYTHFMIWKGSILAGYPFKLFLKPRRETTKVRKRAILRFQVLWKLVVSGSCFPALRTLVMTVLGRGSDSRRMRGRQSGELAFPPITWLWVSEYCPVPPHDTSHFCTFPGNGQTMLSCLAPPVLW